MMPTSESESTANSRSASTLRGLPWPAYLQGPDPALLDQLYVPMLSRAVHYDRCCAYFSSSVLSAAARGFAGLIQRLLDLGEAAPRPAVCLLVNEQLAREDVQAILESGDLSQLEKALLQRLKPPDELLSKQRLGMLAWLVKQGFLELRVGLMRSGQGIFHTKFGIATDAAGDAVVFSGSGNETAASLIANYEHLEISTSWDNPGRHSHYRNEFAALWGDRHPYVHTVPLPVAVREHLIRFALPDPPLVEPRAALHRQKAAMLWRFIAEAPYLPNGGDTCDATALIDPWPHQRRVVEETTNAWPDGRLLCDEVGMGKTIEAILILRRLLAGRGVQRVLVLVPKGLLTQWQEELREKGGLIFPRLEWPTLIWPDGRKKRVDSLGKALCDDRLLVSREFARLPARREEILAAPPWDLIILDEAHAARRREQEEGEFNSATLLLELLRQLQLRRRTRSILLLSATPMQTHPWEPWDLLAVLGEGGAWLAGFQNVRNYYDAVAALEQGHLDRGLADRAADLIVADPDFPRDQLQATVTSSSLAQRLAFATSSERTKLVSWLRRGAPLGRRMHRNTRDTLRKYYERDPLITRLPNRLPPHDIEYDFADPEEREVYQAVTAYINRRFDELEREKPGKGFVMTIYRRRAASSPYALQCSLKRRADGLRRVAERKAEADYLPHEDVPERLDASELPQTDAGDQISAAYPSDPDVARAELKEVESLLDRIAALGGKDTKRDRFTELLRQITDQGRAVLVFSEYVDTMHYLRDWLVDRYGKRLGCYSGDGGETWDGRGWQAVTKDVIQQKLMATELSVLVCTDAASEGLNLQAASAVINYDLPWNPSKVEQRIGRVDRIGQMQPDVRVINLFLHESVDEQVYKALETRCGLFTHFVGHMQPVLARARRMLMGQEPVDLAALHEEADAVDKDPVILGSYMESAADDPLVPPTPALKRNDLVAALAALTPETEIRVQRRKKSGVAILSGSNLSKTRLSADLTVLEGDATVQPLTPLHSVIAQLAETLSRPGEHLPLVINSQRRGAFRASAAYWLDGDHMEPVETLSALEAHLTRWNGVPPTPDAYARAQRAACEESVERVAAMKQQAADREQRALQRQIEAARLRLLRELGRFLVALAGADADFNQLIAQEVPKQTDTARRLRRCLELLGGYPDWDSDPTLRADLRDFEACLDERQRLARLGLSELDAALADPRWQAMR